MTGLRNEKAVCAFDFDGTLVDSMGAFADVAAALIARERGVERDRARRMYLDTSGLPFFQQLEVLFPADPRNGALSERFEQEKLAGYFSRGYFLDVAATVLALRQAGLRVAVCSNNTQENVQRFVAQHGVLFDHVLGYRPGLSKGPEQFEHLRAREGLSREQMVFVGDSLKDGEKTTDYGIEFVAKTGTFTAEKFRERFPQAPIITHLNELVPLLVASGG
jgi:phosphoglycolate phosphatase